ncbi:MAG: shikimate dehydrogenase [Vallitaleaceae bacterium]|jgi:shikimate dehydrogenase|nr:shikimate dehydrogenase [Vallitaleaceae bacterium]
MTNIDGNTHIFGVVGNPVNHSFSPYIHNLLAAKLNINMAYIPLAVKKTNVDHLIDSLKTLNIYGCNVTVPYKVDVIKQLDVVDKKAILIGAVNTIKIVDQVAYGYNTDLDGIKKALEKQKVNLEGKTVLIIGAGGAAKAVAVMCGDANVKKLIIMNRTRKKAKELCETIKKSYEIDCEDASYEDTHIFGECQVAFQTTSIGMHPNLLSSPIKEPKYLSKLDFAMDIIYNPRETRFMKDMQEMGIKTINGLSMLYNQAISAFEIWQDITIDYEISELVYRDFVNYLDGLVD